MTEYPTCGAKLKKEVGTCKMHAGWGTNHVGSGPCKLHGGSTPNVVKAHQRKLLEARVRGELASREIFPVTDPTAAYADLAGEVWAFKELCREKIAELNSWDYTDMKGTTGLEPVIALYQDALSQVQKTLADMLRIGLSAEALQAAKERPSREQAEALSKVIQRLLDDLDLTVDQKMQVPTALANALRAEGLL